MEVCAYCGNKVSWLTRMEDSGIIFHMACADHHDAKKNDLNDEFLKLKEKESEEISSVILTTESNSNFQIIKRFEIITAECAFGMNIFKDFFAGMSDFFGGRNKSTQGVLKDARKTVLYELKKEAHLLGANAVIGVDLDYSEFSGGGKSMLFVVASGTAVILKEETES